MAIEWKKIWITTVQRARTCYYTESTQVLEAGQEQLHQSGTIIKVQNFLSKDWDVRWTSQTWFMLHYTESTRIYHLFIQLDYTIYWMNELYRELQVYPLGIPVKYCYSFLEEGALCPDSSYPWSGFHKSRDVLMCSGQKITFSSEYFKALSYSVNNQMKARIHPKT